MANIKSAEKRIRTSAQKRARNKARVSRLRSSVKKYGQADPPSARRRFPRRTRRSTARWRRA